MSYITYPLKVTGPLPLDVIFEQFITQVYGGEQAWLPVKGFFTKLSQLRGEFQFEQHNLTVANDPASCAKLIEKLIIFYKNLQFLQTKFRFEYFQQGAINIPFQWSNSFDTKRSIATPSLILEKACILYNIAIIYYTEGNNLMTGNPDQRKISTQKFRFGLWAIKEVKQLTVNMAPEIKHILTDFSEANLDILYHTMLGNCYAVLFVNLVDQEDKIKVKNIASLASEASQNYTIALSKANALIQSGENLLPLDHIQKVKSFLFYNTVKHMAIAGMKMSKHHKEAHEDDINGNHVGWAIGYAQNSVNTITKALQNEGAVKLMEKEQINQLNKIKQECEKECAELTQRNTQIYNQPVPDGSKLPRTSLIEQLIIQPAEPKEMQQNLAIDENSFSNFMTEDSMQMVQEIRQFAQQRCSEVENVQKQIFDMKNAAYLENYVNFFIDMNTQKQQQQIPQKITDKVNKYNSLGGTQQLRNYIQTLKDSNVQCGMLLSTLNEKVEKEQSEDQRLRKEYGAKWTRADSSQSNKDYINEIKIKYHIKKQSEQYLNIELKYNLDQKQNLEDNFKIATNIEMENQQRWNQNQHIAALMDKPQSEQIKVFCQGSSEDSFKQQNQQQLLQLGQLDNRINTDMASIKDSIQNINNSIRNTNYNGEVTKALQQKIPQDKILETVLKPISMQIQALNDIITKFSSQVSEVCNLAIELQQKRNSKGSNNANMQQSEEYSNGMNCLIELFDDCQQGMKFYQDLTGLILDLDKKVSDYVQAREIEKSNLVQMINNEQAKTNMNKGGFNAQYAPPPTNLYPPQGGNMYPPQGSNMYPPQGGYFYPPTNPTQTQFYNPNAVYQMPGQNQQQQQHQQPQSNPFYNNGQFNQGQSVFIPQKK